MIDVPYLITALECSCSSAPFMACKGCKYSSEERVEMDSFFYDYVVPDETLEDGTKVFRICDTERMAKDAAAALKDLIGGLDDGR